MWVKQKRQTGFTIVELLIVIVVIAVLAAITTVAFSGIQQRAKDSKRTNEIAQLSKVLEMYYIDNGAYPDCSGGKYVPGTAFNGNTVAICLAQLVPKYLATLPTDPVNTGLYQYRYGFGTKKTGNNTFVSDNSDNYVIGVKLDTSSAPLYSGWGLTGLNYLVGSSR